MPPASGSIEADLETAVGEVAEGNGGQAQVAPGFQQAKSDILERAEALRKSLPKQTAFFQQLEEQMGDLEQEVEDLARRIVLAVRMFQKETAIFLDVETFVLDLPTQPCGRWE